MVMMTSTPPAYYWNAGTMDIIQEVLKWRFEDDLQAYFTIDAGANVHIICEEIDGVEVEKRLKANTFVKWTIVNRPYNGTTISNNHIF